MNDYRIKKETKKSGIKFIVQHYHEGGSFNGDYWSDMALHHATLYFAQEAIDGYRANDKRAAEKATKTEIIEY